MKIEICCMGMLDALIEKNIDIVREAGREGAFIRRYIMRRELVYPTVSYCPFCGAKL